MQMVVETVCYQPPTHPTPHPFFQDLDNANGSGNRRLAIPHPPHPWFLKPAFWLLTLGCWIRLFWLLNPWLLKIVVVESGVLVVESGVLVVESGFFGCWSLGCWIVWLLKPAFLVAEAMVVESGCFGCWIRLFWLLNPVFLVVESGFVGCWSLGCWMFCSEEPAFLVVEAMVVESVAMVVESGVLVVEP